MSEAMQPFLTVRDVLRELAELHAACHARLLAASQASDDLRRKVVLTFLEAREGEQLRAVLRMNDLDDEVLQCFVQSVPASPFDEARGQALVDGDCERIIESYRRREQALASCFAQLRNAVGPRAALLFDNLLALKQHNQMRLREASLDF